MISAFSYAVIRRVGCLPSLLFLLILFSGCAVTRLAPPDEPFHLEEVVPQAAEPLQVTDARSPERKRTQIVEDGFLVGDDLLRTPPNAYISVQLAHALISQELGSKVLRHTSGKPIQLRAFQVLVTKGPPLRAGVSDYSTLPPGIAMASQALHALDAELARPKFVKVRIEVSVGDDSFSDEAYGSYNVIPNNSAIVAPAMRAVAKLANSIAQKAIEEMADPKRGQK